MTGLLRSAMASEPNDTGVGQRRFFYGAAGVMVLLNLAVVVIRTYFGAKYPSGYCHEPPPAGVETFLDGTNVVAFMTLGLAGYAYLKRRPGEGTFLLATVFASVVLIFVLSIVVYFFGGNMC